MAPRLQWRIAFGLWFLLVGFGFVAGHNDGENQETVASSNHNSNYSFERSEELVAEALLALTQINQARFHRKPTPPPNHRGHGKLQAYHISPEVAEAARIVAESSPQIPTGNHSEVVASARNTFLHHDSPSSNNTNAPPRWQTPEGRLSVYGAMGNTTQQSNSGFWMLDMASHGASPLASPGYQVNDSEVFPPFHI